MGLGELNFNLGFIPFLIHFGVPTFVCLLVLAGWEEIDYKFDKIIRKFLTDEQELARFEKQTKKIKRQLERKDARDKRLDEIFGPSWRSYSRAVAVAGILLVFVALLIGWNIVLIFFVYPLL
jgi:hypothetical protein